MSSNRKRHGWYLVLTDIFEETQSATADVSTKPN